MVGKALGTSGFSLPPATANSGSGVLRRDDSLSETEAQVLSLVKQGRTNKQIAAALGIAPATVSAYLIRIGLKLRTSGRAEAVDAAETRGIDLTGDLLEDGSIGSRPSEGVGDAPSPGVREQYEVRGAGAAVGVSGRAGEQDRTEELAAERHRLEELLNVSFGWLDPDDVSVAILLMSELMANALADTDGRVEVVITQTDVEAERRLRFEVRDDSAFVPEIGDMPDEFAERGRGLSMMAIVADEFGTTSFDDGSGKSTWFELHRSLPPGGPVEPVTDAPSAQPTASSNELRASDSDPDGLIGRRPHDPEDADGSGPGTAHRAAPEGFRAALTTQLWGQASSIPADDSVRNHSRRERDMLAVLDHVAGVASGFVASALRQGLDATVVEAVRGLDPADLEAMLVDLGATRSAMIGVLSRFVQLQIHGAITRAAPETRPDVSGYLVPVSAPDGSDSWRTRRLVRRIMENWAGPGEVGWPDPSRIEDAVLLVSELAGNIPRHAHTSGFIIATVTDSPGAPVLRVGIRDYSRTLPKWRNADDDAESGRGGFLLKALATDYGVVQHPDGKTVWFEIRGEPPGTEPAGEQKAPPDQGPGSADEVATGSDFDAALKAAEAAFADIGEDSPPPSSGPEGLIGSAPHDPRETQFPTVVREAMNTGVVQRERLPGAPGVTVERVTFGNGYRSHRETYDNADDAARQWAISVIGGAMGATVAGTHPDADDRTVLYREIMPGRRANTVLPQGMSRLYDQGLVDDPASVAARAVLGPLDRSHLDSESGELLGLLDAVTGTRRSTRNWSIGEDGEVAGGRGAIESEKKDYGPSPFAAKFIRLIEGRTVWQDHPIRRSVITSMRERVAALSDRLAGFAPMQEDMLIAVHRQVLNELVRAERHAVHTPEEAAHFTGVSADAQAKARLAEEFALAHPYIVITGFDHPDVPVDAVREILETLDDLLTRHRYAPNLVAHLTNIRELGIEFLPSDDAVTVYTPGFRRTEWMTLGMSRVSDRGQAVETDARNRAVGIHPSSGRPYRDDVIHEFAHAIDHADDMRFSREIKIVLQDAWADLRSHGLIDESDVEWFQRLLRAAFTDETKSTLDPVEAIAVGFADVEINGPVIGSPQWVIHHFVTTGSPPEITPELVVDLPAVQSDSGSSTPADQPGSGRDGVIGSRPPDNAAAGPRFDPIGARPARADLVYRRYRRQLGQEYRDLAEQLSAVAGEPLSTTLRPELPTVLDHAIDLGGDREVAADTDRLVRLAWRLNCLDELSGRRWADARRLSATGNVAPTPGTAAHRLESLTAELTGYLAAPTAIGAAGLAGRVRPHEAEIATLTRQLDNELAQLFGPPPGLLGAEFPHGVSVADIEGLDAASTLRAQPSDTAVLVRHVDATGVPRFLVVKEPPGENGRPSEWRSPDAAEAVALNVRAKGAVTFTDAGVAVMEASTRFAAGIGAGRIIDARWLTTDELDFEADEGRVHLAFANVFESEWGPYEEVPPPTDVAGVIARSASRLSLSTDVSERLLRQVAGRPATEHDDIVAFFDQLVEWVEAMKMVEASGTVGDGELFDLQHRHKLCMALSTHPDLLQAISTPTGYDTLLDTVHTDGWSIAGIGARVGFLARAEIREALQKVYANNRDFAPYISESLGQPAVVDLDRFGRELRRISEIPARVLDRILLEIISQYVGKSSEFGVPPAGDMRSMTMAAKYRVWKYLAALDDHSPDAIRKFLAQAYLRSGRIGEFATDVFGVAFTGQELRDVEDLYIDRTSGFAFVRYVQLVAGLSPSHRPPTIRAALELMTDVTAEFAQNVRALMGDGEHGRGQERAVLGLQNTGAAALPELKAVVRAMVDEVHSGHLSHDTLVKIRKSDVLASVLMGVTHYSLSTWGPRGIGSLRRLLRYYDQAETDGRIPAMPEAYRPSGVIEIRRLRSRSGSKWTEDLLTRFARLAGNLRAAHSAIAGVRRPITHLLGELGQGIVEHMATLERSLASGTLANGDPMNEVARRKMGERVQELRKLVASEPGSANPFPALRSLKDFEKNFQRLAAIGELHDHLRTICFAWAMQQHPEWKERLQNIGTGAPTLEEISLVREFVDHITNQEVFSHYFSDRKGARTFRRMTSAIALEEAISRAQGVGVARETTPLRFIPTRGPLLELSGHIASVCWAGSYPSLAETMPNMTAVIMVRNPDDSDRARLVGAALLIETTSPSGAPLLLVRGLNPVETYINHVSADDFYQKFTDWAHGVAAARGRRLAIVIDDYVGGAATNRPALFQYLEQARPSLTPIQVRAADTTFNGYNVSQTAYLVGPADAAEQEQQAGLDDRIGSRPPENPAPGSRRDMIGARPVEAGTVYRRYRDRIGKHYRDLATRLGVVAGERWSRAIRPAVLNGAVDVGGDRDVRDDADRLLRLAWRLACFDELAGRVSAETWNLGIVDAEEDQEFEGAYADRPMPSRRLESLTTELAAQEDALATTVAGDDRARYHQAEIARLAGQLDNELAGLLGSPPGSLEAGFPDGAAITDIDGLGGWNVPRDLAPDVRVLVRHVDVTGVARFLVVADSTGADNPSNRWRPPDVAETVALNVRGASAARLDDSGLVVVDTPVRFAAAIGAGRIMDARWLTANELSVEKVEGRLHPSSADTVDYVSDVYGGMFSPIGTAEEIAQSTSRLMSSTDAVETLVQRFSARPAREHAKIATFLDQLAKWSEEFEMSVEAFAAIGASDRLDDRARRQQICIALATHPDLMGVISSSMAYEVLIGIMHIPGWTPAGAGALVEFLARSEIRDAVRKISRTDRHLYSFARGILKCPIVEDFNRVGRELSRVAEIPAGVLEHSLAAKIRQYAMPISESDTSAVHLDFNSALNDVARQSSVALTDYRAWNFLAALEDYSPESIRNKLASEYLRSGRIDEITKDVFGAVVFTERQLQEVEDVYIERASRSAFGVYFRAVAALAPKRRPPIIGAALELVREVTPELARSLRAIMADGRQDGERDLLGLRGAGAAVLPELKVVVRALLSEVNSGDLSHQSLTKVQSSNFVASILMGVTRYSESEWGAGDIASLRQLLDYNQRANADGHIAAMPDVYRPSGVVEVAKLRTRSDPQWTEDLLNRFARLASNLRDAHSAMTRVRRPITQLLGELGRGIVEHVASLERSLASGRLSDGSPVNAVARRKVAALARELRTLVASDSAPVNQFPALRSLKDFENNFELLSGVKELHDHLRTVCFAWAMQKHPEWINRLRDIGVENPSLEEVVLVREFVDHITNQEVFSHYFSDRKGARAFRRMTSAIALEEAIFRTQGVGVANDSTRLQFIPTRGPLLELSGHIASACWAGNYHSVAEAMPNMTAAIMVQNPDDPDHARLAGAGLLIETTSRSGIPVLLIRGLNPQESFINHVSVGDFYRTFTDWARGLAAARGRHLAIVIDEIAGRAATNRPALFGYLADVSRYLTPIEVDMANTTFNGYDVSRRVFLVGPAAAADHQRRTQSDDRIGSRPPTEPGASGDVLQSLTTPESVLGWVRSGVRAGDNGNSDRQALIDHLRERAVFAHPDTGYRSPDGGLSDNRDMRRDHAAKAREIADRLATDPAYGPADAHHDARLHASEMREEYGGFRWQLAVSNVDVSNPAALAAAVAARLPEEDSKPAHKDIVDAAARLAELARPVAGEDAVFVVTSSGDTDGRHRLLARLDYDRPDSTNPDPGVTADELRRGLSDVDGRIDLDTAEPTPEGHVRHSIRLDLTRQRILVCCGLWGQGRTGMSTVNLALCEGLAAAGHDVTVLPDKVAPGFRVPGVQVYAPSERTRYRNAEYLESLPKSVDMVVVHSEANGIEAALNAEKLYPTAKLVAIYHLLPMLWATVQGEQARGRGRLAAGIYLARRAHLVTGLGPALAADAMSQAAMAEHGSVHELRPVLDMAEQPSQPSPGSPVRILMFGRLSDRLKGDAEMAQVVRQLRAQGRDVRLVVRGYDQDLAGTKARLAQIVGDPDAIEVKPHTSDRGEIRADIRAATVVVMPSRAEGFGGVATEAIEQGVPVLVPSTSGVGQFLAALAGYLDTAKQFNLVTQAQGAPVPIDEWLAGLGDVLDDVPGAWAAARRLQELLRPLTRENSARMLVHATVNTEPRSRPETRPSRTLVSRVARQVVARGEEEDYLRILAVVDAMETDPAVRSAIIGRAGIEFAPSPGALPIRLAAADPDEWLFVPSTRTDVDQDDSRGRILGAMVATVSERGFAAATVDEVSRRAGVTPDDFHEKFSRTYDAFAAARQLALENLRQLVVEEVGALRAPDRASRMTTVVNTYVNAVAARPATARAVLIEASGLDLPERASCAMTVTNSIAITLGEVLEPAMSVQVRRALSAAVNARLAEWAATGDVAAVPGLQRDLADLLRIGTASPVLKPTADGVRPPPGADDGVAAEQAKPDEQERILTQLIAVAARHGYAKMSLETVQQWAEVSSRTYRELFTDKATGFEVACAAGIERLRTACRAALSDSVDGDLRARLEMAVRNYLMVLAKHGDETRVLHLELPTDGPLRDRFHSMLAEHLIDAVDEIDARTGGLLASAVTGIVADKIAARQYARFRDLPSSELNAAAMTSLPGDAPIMAAWAHALLTGAELPSSPPPDAPNPPETTKPASRSPWTGKRAGPTPWG
ncbi:LuxR C-terminal-related transcriptional regulator [Nocardia sp. NPDC052254]|uniref:LuxR C-terminal-related transcriptional regulator n=1 Tax=Nocardia sp. NPDC052254 TaxID=3155681 RepID=UPI00344354A7